jgi:predicted regulator of Ras-like GTPase activity (Roadblock/LC7/MglB family)
MTIHSEYLSGGAQQFNWLLKQFATKTPEVMDAIAVSSDGLLIAMANPGNRDDADRLAAITSGVLALGHSASRVYDLGQTNKIIMDMDRGYVLVSAISAGSALGVLAARTADLGNLAYQMAVFANRAGGVLTPQLIEELKVTV